MHRKTCGGEFGGFFDDAKRQRLLRGVVASYHGDNLPPQGGVLFDTNRSWTGRLPLLGGLFPECRVICCVREVGWILDSLEAILARNPLELSKVVDFDPGNSVYSRAERLMNSETGLVGRAWASLREAWFCGHAAHLIVVPYERLVSAPAVTIAKLYAELGEPAFPHDFDRVTFDAPGYDAELGLPGLHRVEGKVAPRHRQGVLPPDLFRKYASANFWAEAAPNPHRVVVVR